MPDRLRSLKGYYIDVMSDGERWEFTFTVREVRGKCKSMVRAICLSRPGKKLVTPQDFDEMTVLLPVEYWPPFSLNFGANVAPIPQNERLF